MPVSHGFESIMGIGTEITAGTPVVVTEKIPYISESIQAQFNHVQDNSLCGPAARPKSQQGTLIAEGGFELHFRYTLAQQLLEHFFGSLLVDTPGVGTNTYSLDPSIDGAAVTIAIEKTVAVWEHAGYKASELTITGSPTDGIRIEVDGFCVNTDYASGTNTSGVLSALSSPGDFMLFQDMTFRVGDLTDALDSSDDLAISSFSLNINRALSPTEVNSSNRLEALENAFRETTLEINIPRYEAQTFIDFHAAHTQLQATLSFTDGTNTKTISIPNMLVMEWDAEVGGPEFVEHPVTFTCHPDSLLENAFIVLQDPLAEVELTET